MTIYQENGFETRRAYLKSLQDDTGAPWSVIATLADLYGPNEDFDGLVTHLEDLEQCGGFDEFEED